ncbi:MAG TPA: NAD(P)H-binding protein [Thermoanaerobaculales bacterium]|nr:NAD(P)H-binding protein [Thermoanaerobaculales bacterium]HQL30141.1 NAD(P)H-binding protein [Thermoanaerobaculales bacterium]
MRILVTGATGYIGGRLVPRLVEDGHQVRVLVRDPGRIAGRPWADHVELAVGDVEAPASLRPACAGVDVAYYFVAHKFIFSAMVRRIAREALAPTRPGTRI